jgi:hypothetical protein
MGLTIRYCRECGRDQLFDQPHDVPGECPDNPGANCLEWACTGCGAALFTVVPGLTASAGHVPADRVA